MIVLLMENEEKQVNEEVVEKKHFGLPMKVTTLLYAFLCNLPVTASLCLTSSIYGVSSVADGALTMNFGAINWGIFFINWGVAMVLAVIVGYFVPLVMIGRWFTRLFKVDDTTYKGNMPYRLLASLVITVIYFLAITPSLTVFNWLVFRFTDFPTALINMLKQSPFILIVGYTVSLITDVWVYQIAHRVNENF